jgi:HD-like signal output (HDOD) protein
MLAKLLQWFRPAARRVPSPAATQHVGGSASVQATTRGASDAYSEVVRVGSTPRSKGPAELASDARAQFFDELAESAEAVEVSPPLNEAEERLTGELVMRLVDHLRRKKVDPPVMPALVPRVLATVGEAQVDITRLARLIEQDLAISAKLLSVANSSAFGGNTEIKTVREAVRFLGTEQVAQVAIGLACSSLYQSGAKQQEPALAARWARLFQHGLTVAMASSAVLAQLDRQQAEQGFLGGLFHDVGKAVALRALENLAGGGKLPDAPDFVIDEVLQRMHAYPGDEFYAKWTLPAPLMQLCAQHHQVADVVDAPSAFYVVSLSSSLDALARGSAAERQEALAEARLSADHMGFSAAALRQLQQQLGVLSARTRHMFTPR